MSMEIGASYNSYYTQKIINLNESSNKYKFYGRVISIFIVLVIFIKGLNKFHNGEVY